MWLQSSDEIKFYIIMCFLGTSITVVYGLRLRLHLDRPYGGPEGTSRGKKYFTLRAHVELTLRSHVDMVYVRT